MNASLRYYKYISWCTNTIICKVFRRDEYVNIITLKYNYETENIYMNIIVCKYIEECMYRSMYEKM